MWYALYSCFRRGARVVRRNICVLVLIALLSPWAFFLWQLETHFGGLFASPFAAFKPHALPAIDAPPVPTPLLLVSAYFPLSKSRYTMQQYNIWMTNLLGRVTSDLYIFTSPEMASTIRQMRGKLPVHINTTYSSVYDIPVVKGLLNEFTYQYAKDRQAQKFSAELYMLRTAKPWFLHEAVQNVNVHGTKVTNHTVSYRYAFWSDAGGMREKGIFSDWPSIDRVDSVWAEGEDAAGRPMRDLLFVPIDRQPAEQFMNWKQSDGPMLGKTEFSEGTFFGGPPLAVEWWAKTFYELLKQYLSEGRSISSDRAVTNALMFLHPDRFITVFNRDPVVGLEDRSTSSHGSYGYCGDPWFYYVFWLSQEGERDEQNILWSAAGWRWDFWRQRQWCRMARTLSVKSVLARTYGPRWTPPTPTLPTIP